MTEYEARYEVHRNSPKGYEEIAFSDNKKKAIDFAVKMAKKEKDPMTSYGVYDSKKNAYLGFAMNDKL